MRDDLQTRALKAIMIIIGIIDIILMVVFAVFISNINTGKMLSSIGIFISSILWVLINFIGLLYIPIYIKCRKDK